MATGDKLVNLDSLKEVYDSVKEDTTNLILAQDTEPQDSDNKLWFDTDSDQEVSVPTMTDYNSLSDEISTKVDEPSSEGTSGQVLTTDGAGGRTWTDMTTATVTLVSGENYTLNLA